MHRYLRSILSGYKRFWFYADTLGECLLLCREQTAVEYTTHPDSWSPRDILDNQNLGIAPHQVALMEYEFWWFMRLAHSGAKRLRIVIHMVGFWHSGVALLLVAG